VVDVDGGGKRAVQGLAAVRVEVAGRGDLLRLGDDLGVEVLVRDEGGLDDLGEGLLGAAVLDDAAPGLDDVEGVDRDVVGPGDDLRAEDVQAGDAEGAGELVEEARPGPR
jgi:hypothetical protein